MLRNAGRLFWDERAKQFYMQHAGFQEMPGQPLHLLLSVKGIERYMA